MMNAQTKEELQGGLIKRVDETYSSEAAATGVADSLGCSEDEGWTYEPIEVSPGLWKVEIRDEEGEHVAFWAR